MPVNDVFGALANPVRRRILDLLRERPRAAGDIAARFALKRPAVSEHLAVLRATGLVIERARGRQRIYSLNATALSPMRIWLQPFERHWQARLHTLSATVRRR